jgi:O-antigen ligase
MIASLILALYQGLVDIKFLNNPVFASDNRVSGLCGDANGLGISIFLLFPLCFLAILNIREFWKKLFFGLLSVILLWCLALSGSRTGLFGIIIFMVFSPLLLIYGNPDRFKGWYKVMILSSTLFSLLLISIGLVAFERGFSPSTILMKRINTSYFDIKEGGIGRPLSGRLELWRQACRLTMLSPLAGWGPGGFYRNLDNIRFRNGENSIVFDNADNYYLQMSSDLGILGASFNLLLHFMPLWMVFRIRKKIQDQEERLAIRICFAIVSIMMVLFVVMPNTIGITPMFILVILLAFLFVTALKYGYSFEKVNIKFLGISLALLTILFIFGTYDTTFGQNGYKSMRQAPWWPLKYVENCYGIEEWEEEKLCWCKKDAFIRIPLFKPLPQKVKLIFIAFNPDIQSNPVVVKFGGKAGVKYEVVVKDNSWKMVEIPITSEDVYEFTRPNKSVTKYLILSLDVSRTWIPKEWGVSQDTRELGVLVSVSSLWRALYGD